MTNDLTEGKGAVWNTVRAVLQSGREGPALEHVRRDGPQPASFGQHGVWLDECLTPATPLRNLAVIVTFHGTLSSQCLERSLSEIVRRHEVFRTTVHFLQGQLVQVIHETAAFEMPLVDLRDLDPAALGAEAQRQCELEARKPFDLDRPPILRARLFRIGDCQYQLVLTIHHLAFDGSSFDPFMRELCATYDARIAGETPAVPDLQFQYVDFAAW
ncbi:MAG TPA: condensation domain-containing protein, partial [Terriglobia bacterium]|nr:condensation domain-containing protein [Terriglobia bacterium]